MIQKHFNIILKKLRTRLQEKILKNLKNPPLPAYAPLLTLHVNMASTTVNVSFWLEMMFLKILEYFLSADEEQKGDNTGDLHSFQH